MHGVPALVGLCCTFVEMLTGFEPSAMCQGRHFKVVTGLSFVFMLSVGKEVDLVISYGTLGSLAVTFSFVLGT